MYKILCFYRCPASTIAFLDGIFLSTAINLLTGMNSYSGLSLTFMWIAVGLMGLGTIILFLFQNIASNLQESYLKWKSDREEHNIAYPEDAKSFPTDWTSFIKLSVFFHPYFSSNKVNSIEENNELEKKFFQRCNYSKHNLYLRLIFSFVPLLISIVFMILAMHLSVS